MSFDLSFKLKHKTQTQSLVNEEKVDLIFKLIFFEYSSMDLSNKNGVSLISNFGISRITLQLYHTKIKILV